MEKSLNGRIGVLGGTFDPVHLGHLLLAEQAVDRLDLDHVVWIPAAIAPHPTIKQATHQKHRLEMVQLATAGNPRFLVDDRELRRGGQSYTVDTLLELHQEHPAATLLLLMGSDSLAGFPLWREPHRICQLAHVIVIVRGGQPAPDMKILERYLPTDFSPVAQENHESGSFSQLVSDHLMQMPEMEISSTDIRERARLGKSIRYMVPGAVEAYIQSNGLYGEKSQAG